MLHITRSLPKNGLDEPKDKIVVILPDGKQMLIYLTEVKGRMAKISFEFEYPTKVYRSELWDKIRRGEDADICEQLVKGDL